MLLYSRKQRCPHSTRHWYVHQQLITYSYQLNFKLGINFSTTFQYMIIMVRLSPSYTIWAVTWTCYSRLCGRLCAMAPSFPSSEHWTATAILPYGSGTFMPYHASSLGEHMQYHDVHSIRTYPAPNPIPYQLNLRSPNHSIPRQSRLWDTVAPSQPQGSNLPAVRLWIQHMKICQNLHLHLRNHKHWTYRSFNGQNQRTKLCQNMQRHLPATSIQFTFHPAAHSNKFGMRNPKKSWGRK